MRVAPYFASYALMCLVMLYLGKVKMNKSSYKNPWRQKKGYSMHCNLHLCMHLQLTFENRNHVKDGV